MPPWLAVAIILRERRRCEILLNHVMSKRHVVVLGGGISGLAVANALSSHKDIELTIVSDKWISDTLSGNAPGLWTPHLSTPPEKVLEWSKATYELLCSEILAGYPVQLAPVKVVAASGGVPKMLWWMKDILVDFTLSETEAKYMSPTIQTPAYMKMKMKQLSQKKVVFVQQRITSITDFVTNWRSLPIDLVVNCLGHEAGAIVPDPGCYPIRGVLLKAKPKNYPRSSLIVIGNSPHFAYVTNRPDVTVIGGSTEVGNSNITVSPEEAAMVIKRAVAEMPELEANGPLEVYDNWAGLRPGRDTVRLELDTKTFPVPVVHNYGHGGSGWTLSHGCALDVTKLVVQQLYPSKL
eukprot:TRINITY_DN2181_c0_g1_i1.p1 TRINITY_DN2181_c0_g1~~TRINITY_DN2181_c0_g1_i1.p1  ORF type:complete len:351 (-),score=58.25 TRINITY_DN2181_c0_g1_i1:56-1108(-)